MDVNDYAARLRGGIPADGLSDAVASGVRRCLRGRDILYVIRDVLSWNPLQSLVHSCEQCSSLYAPSEHGIPAGLSFPFARSSFRRRRGPSAFFRFDFFGVAWGNILSFSTRLPASVLLLFAWPKGSDSLAGRRVKNRQGSRATKERKNPGIATEVTPARSRSDNLSGYRDRKSHTMNRHLNNAKPRATSPASLQANHLIP